MNIKYNFFKKHLNFLCLAFFVVLGNNGYTQISGGELKSDKDKKEKKEKSKEEEFQRTLPPFNADSLSGSCYYVTGLAQYSYRYFEDNSVYDKYATWLDQEEMYTGGVSLGMIMPVAKGLSIDAGLAFFTNGESYYYEDPTSDSIYQYTNVYAQVGIPFKLRYTYGNDFQVYGFAGLTPLNILALRNRSSYQTAEGVSTEEVFTKTRQGYTGFNVMFSGGIGFNYFVNYFGVTFNAEYRRHLGNTYADDTFKRIHKMYGIGINLGLIYRI